jgi:hypothetical protein
LNDDDEKPTLLKARAAHWKLDRPGCRTAHHHHRRRERLSSGMRIPIMIAEHDPTTMARPRLRNAAAQGEG